MSSVIFQLRKPTSKEIQPISLVYRFGKTEKLVYSTGLKVLPKNWNATTQRVRNVTDEPNKDYINNILHELETEAERLIIQSKGQSNTFGKAELKKGLDVYLGRAEVKDDKNIGLFQFIELFIKQSENRINPSTGKKISERTIKKYRTTYTDLQKFQKSFNRKIDFDTIDVDFYLDYTAHLQALDYSTNTVGKYIQTLKVFLNEATTRGINTKLLFKSSRFTVVSEQSESIYLNEDEINKMYNFDLSHNTRLERVRDMFIVGCWTGLRFSDLSTLSKSNIKADFIEVRTEKTGVDVEIPIHPTVKEILKKYSYNLPNEISNQKMNDYLKEVGQLVGLDEPTSLGITKGGVRRYTTYPKYELITTHTSRRSFATNLFISGFPAISIMQITGHKTEKSFLKYIKAKGNEHAKALREHWLKQRQHLKVI